ncbi:MAG: glycosyltransferase family 1 protein, partial [Bradyrhizobium sp.]|nr:glycosyltransferase family 1 protein [Bradyrhizobium sp.]
MLHYQPNKALGETTATALPPPNGGGRKPHVLLVQTQAENAGAQEISRLLGARLTARGYRVTNLFFFRKSDSFDEPPDTIYCASSRPGNPLALLQMLWTLGGHIRAT